MSSVQGVGGSLEHPSKTFNLLTPVPFRSLGAKKFFKTWKPSYQSTTENSFLDHIKSSTKKKEDISVIEKDQQCHRRVVETRSLDRNLITKKTDSGEEKLARTKSIGAWFESVQNQAPPKKGGVIWNRDTKSPFHERIQKTKSLYESMSQDTDSKPSKTVDEPLDHPEPVSLPPKPRSDPNRTTKAPISGPAVNGTSKYAEFKSRASSKGEPKLNTQTEPNRKKRDPAIEISPNRFSPKESPSEKVVDAIQHEVTEKKSPRDMPPHLSNGYINATSTKSSSLPGFYSRRTGQQGLNDGFAANRISFFETNRHAPPSAPTSTHDVTMETPSVKPQKKSFLRKFFSSKKSAVAHVSSTSASDSDDLIQKRNWYGRRRQRKKISASTSSIAPISMQPSPMVTMGSLQTIPPSYMSCAKPSVQSPSSNQPLGIPVWSAKEMSVSYDSLPVSPRSYNSESAYGSINSVAQSQCPYSSTDTLTRREKKEAAMAKVERLRSSQRDSSSEEDLAYHYRQGSQNRKDRSSRTERYIRRKSHEMESLRKETEKDRRTKAIVEARIKEIQNVQLREAQRSLPQRDADEEVKSKWSARLVYQESNEFDEVVLGRPTPPNYNCVSPTSYRNYTSNQPPATHTASYEAHVNKASSLPPNSPPNVWKGAGMITKVSPTPPRRRSSKFLSPQSTPRPMSYSFEKSQGTNGLHSPREDALILNGHSDVLGYKSPYGSHNHKRASSEQRSFEPRLYPFSNKPRRLGPEPWVAPTREYDTPRGTAMEIDCTSTVPVTTIIPTNLPPSPSSDYSSGVSENSSKSDKNFPGKEEINPLDKLTSVLQSEPYCSGHPNDVIKTAEKITQNPKIKTDQINKGLGKTGERADFFKMNSSSNQNGVSMRKSFVEKFENASFTAPQPPKRNSSNLSKDTRDMLSSQLKMLIDHDVTSKKTTRPNNVDVEKAIEEMEEIYKHLNLNIDNILEGAERRDLPTAHQLMWNGNTTTDGQRSPQRGRSITPRARKSITPDRVRDDLHFRRCQSTGPSQRRRRMNAVPSYLLVSPAHGPPPEPKSPIKSVAEPDVIADDLCYRNIQKANSVKVLEPQPPFGVPLNPVIHHNKSDYLHTKVKENFKPIRGSKKIPDVDMDDLAFRNLRKEIPSRKSVNLSGLEDALTELKTSDTRRIRSSSVDRIAINRNNDQNKDEFWRSRQVRHLPRTKGKKKFIDKYKEALTDNETKSRTTTKKESDASDHGPMSPGDTPDIREAVITQSRNPCGGKPLEPFSITVNESEFKTINMSPANKNPFIDKNNQCQPSNSKESAPFRRKSTDPKTQESQKKSK